MTTSQVDRAIGVMLGGAVGDALGWPQEDRSQIIGGRDASEVEPRPQFRSWERNGGTRYGRYVDPVRAGEYSDDTQLMLATARSCLLGDEWIERLRRVELPQWPLYQRGGGGAVLRAARAWEHGKEPWSVGTAKDRDDAVKYFNAGANGVAMRIAPHAVIAASMSIDQLLKRIVLDGLSTHGHPRALMGACVHGLAIRYSILRESTLEYGELLDYIVSEPSWRDPQIFCGALPPGWIESYEVAAYRGKGHGWRPADIWEETTHEVDSLLRAAHGGLRQGALANDEEVLRNIGCFDREGGSGTVSAVAAAYVAARTASRPISGLLRTGFMRKADTDTIASMTGSILGAIHGPQWLNSLGTSVQDSGYIVDLAAALVTTNGGASYHLHSTELSAKSLRDWSDQLSATAHADVLPDGRPFKIIDTQRLATKTKNYVVRIVGRTGDGQTLFIDQVAKEPTEVFRRSHALGSRAERAASAPPPPQFARIDIQSKDLRMSREFYENVLRLACNLEEGRLYVGSFLSIREEPKYDGKSSAFTIMLAVSNLAAMVSGDEFMPGPHASWSLGADTLRCTDPDGHQIQLIQAASDVAPNSQSGAGTQFGASKVVPWQIAHRRGSMYELRNATDTPMFGVEISGEGVLRTMRADRIDGRSGIGFMGLDVFGGSDRVDVRWYLNKDRSDKPQTWSASKPSGTA